MQHHKTSSSVHVGYTVPARLNSVGGVAI